MLREITYLPEADIVQLRTDGTYVLHAEIETLERLAVALKKHDCRKLLIDHRQTTVIAPALDTYDRPDQYARIWGDSSTLNQIKTAIVFHEINEDYQFLENVIRNRGWDLRIFTEYETALDWLSR